jgi:flagellar hook-basal body protein
MGYGIGLAGLASTAEAIDVTSNNIANAQTVGYKSGEYVFADMYFKAADAQAKDRVGMGSFRQSIRRTTSYGTVVNSQNVLDMAISGPGMFMLAKSTMGTIPTESPSKFEYTRNGQFGTDSQNRIVNDNGLLLCGFPADDSGNIISGAKSVLTLDQRPLQQKPTEKSVIDVNLDNRNATLKKVFDHTNSTTFSQATSQTVYDQYGNGHILGMYYKKVETQPLTLVDDAAGGFAFQATQAIPSNQQADFEQDRQKGRISTTFNGADANIQNGIPFAANTQTIKGAQLNKVGNVSGVGSNWDMRLADGTHLAVKMARTVNDFTTTVSATGVSSAAAEAASAGLVAGKNFQVIANGKTYTNSTFDSTTTLTQLKTWLDATIPTTDAVASFTGTTTRTLVLTPAAGATAASYGVINKLAAAGSSEADATSKSAGLVAGDVFKVTANGVDYTNTTFNSETTLAQVKAWIDAKVPTTAATAAFTSATVGSVTTYTLELTAGAGATAASYFKTNTATYDVDADRYAVYATIDGFPVGHDPNNIAAGKRDANKTITVDGLTFSEHMSVGTMAFIGGKNIDTIEKGTDGLPLNGNTTKFDLIADGGPSSAPYGRNNSLENLGVLQFTVKSDNMSALTSQGQTYANTQDGHTVSNLTGYSIDPSGKLIATYDNGETAVKGQLILAYFNNVGGLMPNGSNTFTATENSGEPLLSFPGDGLMGQVRSKSLEQSNVDMTNELVKLMVLQRQYSAMSQATKVMAATIIDDTINIGR